MKRHTAKYYERRIQERQSMGRAMGFQPLEGQLLVLHDVSKKADRVSFRETMALESEAIAMMIDGRALRMSVTNSQRTVHLYIDP